MFTYQFLTQNWSDTNRTLKQKQPVLKCEALGHLVDSEPVILVEQQIGYGECLAMKGDKCHVITVKREQPQTVRMEDSQGVSQQYLQYQVSERLEVGQTYVIAKC